MTFPNSGTQFAAQTFVRALSISNGSTANPNIGAQTYVDKFQSNTLTAGGSLVRLTLQGNNTGTTSVTACYIGNAASTGNAYNFDGGQVQVTFNSGVVSASIPTGAAQRLISDAISFSINPANALCIAFNFSNTNHIAFGTSLGANYTRYTFTGSQAASTVKSTGYTANGGQSAVVSLIEVF